MKRHPKKSSVKPRRREKVLVVMHPDGLVEIYGGRELDVCVAQRLHVPQHCEPAAENYLDGTLPKRYRGLFFPGKLRATGLCETVTPEKALDTLWRLEILKGLRAMRQEQSAAAVPAAIQRERGVAQ